MPDHVLMVFHRWREEHVVHTIEQRFDKKSDKFRLVSRYVSHCGKLGRNVYSDKTGGKERVELGNQVLGISILDMPLNTSALVQYGIVVEAPNVKRRDL